jgi:hypothetical protein
MDQLQLNQLLLEDPFAKLPKYPNEQRKKPNVPHAPIRALPLDAEEKKVWTFE